MSESILRIPVPQVLEVQRQSGRIQVGDWAQVRLEPAILNLLMHPIAGGVFPVGKDLHPMTTVPTGIAIDAATQAVGVDETGVGTLRAMSFTMDAPCPLDEALIARGEVLHLGTRHVKVGVQVRTAGGGVQILTGEVVLVRVVGGRAVEYPR